MGVLIERKPNPAKELLQSYRYLLKRRDALSREAEESFGRAVSCTVRMKPNKVSGGSASYDRMADDIVKAVDACGSLQENAAMLGKKLQTILAMIEAVPDERWRLVLTLRYIRGMSWDEIAREMHYERTQIFVFHGKALLDVNRRMEHDSN